RITVHLAGFALTERGRQLQVHCQDTNEEKEQVELLKAGLSCCSCDTQGRRPAWWPRANADVLELMPGASLLYTNCGVVVWLNL
ncbi:MAG: hypothetical protein ACKPKO_37245, partial [Candidatus Fonsibacter sp.]